MPPRQCCCCPDCDDRVQYRDKHGKCCGCCGPAGNQKAITLNAYGECNCCCHNEETQSGPQGDCPSCGECPPCTEDNLCDNGFCPEKNEITGKCECPCNNAQCSDGKFASPPNCLCPPPECPECHGGESPSILKVEIPAPKCGSSGFVGQDPIAADCDGRKQLNCPTTFNPDGTRRNTCPDGNENCDSLGGTNIETCQDCRACKDLGGSFTLRSGGSVCWLTSLTHCWTRPNWSHVEQFVPYDFQEQWLRDHTLAPGVQGSAGCHPVQTGCTQWSIQRNVPMCANASPFGLPQQPTCPPSGCKTCETMFCRNNDGSCPDAFCESTGNLANNCINQSPIGGSEVVVATLYQGIFGGQFGWGYSLTYYGVGTWVSKQPLQVAQDGKPVCGASSSLELLYGQCPAVWTQGCCYQSATDANIIAM